MLGWEPRPSLVACAPAHADSPPATVPVVPAALGWGEKPSSVDHWPTWEPTADVKSSAARCGDAARSPLADACSFPWVAAGRARLHIAENDASGLALSLSVEGRGRWPSEPSSDVGAMRGARARSGLSRGSRSARARGSHVSRRWTHTRFSRSKNSRVRLENPRNEKKRRPSVASCYFS